MNRRLRHFFANEAAGGIVMMLAAAAALLAANSPLAQPYHAFLHAPLPGGVDVHFAVLDLLMPLFFLLVGLELKQEMQGGNLATRQQRTLPLLAALGGIAAPALIYLAVTRGEASFMAGWAIPTATDIAFAVAIVGLAGARVPVAARVFLLAIAIYDDLAAILIIALFYSAPPALLPLAAAAALLGAMWLLNRLGRAAPVPILLLALPLGYALHAAGIHTTVAGMAAGLCIAHRHGAATLHALHPYVAFGVLPLFAFTHAGIDFSALSPASLLAPLPLGIALGLWLGKPLGILAATYAAVRCGVARLPAHTGWPMLAAIGCVAGIGFTMSLFIGQLAFAADTLQQQVRLGVLAGSVLAACVGLWALRCAPSAQRQG